MYGSQGLVIFDHPADYERFGIGRPCGWAQISRFWSQRRPGGWWRVRLGAAVRVTPLAEVVLAGCRLVWCLTLRVPDLRPVWPAEV
jgi:hypothetical protein